MNKELVFLRTFAIATVIGMIFLIVSFKKNENQKFGEIDVERINIVEKDGTIKLIITNTDRFPTGDDKINGRPTNSERKDFSGMLFFNKDGMESGGFIYNGQKNADGHEQGLSLTYDQYNGDQVLQLITGDYQQGDQRFVASGLVLQDRSPKECQLKMFELQELEKTDPEEAKRRFKEYREQGYFGGNAPRVMLGNTPEQKGLFLFDDKGVPRAMFYVNEENNAKLDFLDEKGNIIATFPEK